MWVHLNVVNLRIPSHGSARREHAGIALGPDAGRMDIRKVHAPLLPPCSHHIGTDEGQQTVAAPGLALAQQYVGLVDAIDRPVGGYLAANEAGEGRKKSIVENIA